MKNVKITLSLPEKLVKKIEEVQERELDTTRSETARKLLLEALEERGESP